MAYPTTFTWAIATASFVMPPTASLGPASTPTYQVRNNLFKRGIGFANVPGGKAENVVHGGPRVWHVNCVMNILQQPSDKYFGDDPGLMSGVVRFRGHSARMVRVPNVVCGQSPRFVSLAENPTVHFASSGTVPLTMSFTDQTTSAEATVVSWAWTFGHGTGSTDRHASHMYDVTGSYLVTLSASDSWGNTGASGTVVVVG